jgi:serine/threonine protein kinase
MGEVYRARDTRLGRDVAIKVLPKEVAANSARLSRFEQECRSASALNHPSIVTIYDIGSFDSTSYIAMEYVEGKTLRETLGSGPILLRRGIHIAAQVADGLAKAHAAGIVHRDLKPENIMITKDGFGKDLDLVS